MWFFYNLLSILVFLFFGLDIVLLLGVDWGFIRVVGLGVGWFILLIICVNSFCLILMRNKFKLVI